MAQPQRSERVSIPAPLTDITATLWLPEDKPEQLVVIHPATATPQGFYRSFASSLAQRCIVGLTYDYRGTCLSGSPKEFNVLMRDWLVVDMPTVTQWARKQFPSLPIAAVGHSIGGHGLVLGSGNGVVDRFALVATHMAETKAIPTLKERLRVRALLNGVGPLTARAVGYIPSSKFGLGEDMPARALLEWSSWTNRPSFLYDDPTFDIQSLPSEVTSDVLAITASDDLWATPQQESLLTKTMTNAHVTERIYTPTELGVERVGHHGLLHRKTGTKVWSDLADWLTASV